jgi:hypothetical protein
MSLLRVTGEVVAPCELGWEDLARLPEQVADIAALVPGREGGGVRLRAVLNRAGLKDGATHVTCESSDGQFAASVPLGAVRDAVIVYRLGAAPLPEEKGGPLRFYIPAADDCLSSEVDHCANVKHLARLCVSRGAGHDTRPTTDAEHAALHDGQHAGD